MKKADRRLGDPATKAYWRPVAVRWLRWCILLLAERREFRHPLARGLRSVGRVGLRSIRTHLRPRPRWRALPVTFAEDIGPGSKFESAPDVVSAAAMREAAAALGVPAPSGDGVRCRLLRAVNQAHKGSRVYRLLWEGPNSSPSALILKRIRLPAPDSSLPREVAVYRSGVLARLPEQTYAARHLRSVVLPDGSYDLWLEDVAPATRAVRRHPGDIREVARALGVLNGAPWVRGTELAGSGANITVRRAGLWMADRGWTAGLAAGSRLAQRLERLLQDSPDLLKAFGALDMTFCHQDASRLNVLLGRGAAPRRVTLLDWELCGPAPLGQELVPLLWAQWEDARYDEIETCEEHAWQGYLAGLDQAGLASTRAGRETMRFAYAAALALRYAAAISKIGDASLINLVLRKGEQALAMIRA